MATLTAALITALTCLLLAFVFGYAVGCFGTLAYWRRWMGSNACDACQNRYHDVDRWLPG